MNRGIFIPQGSYMDQFLGYFLRQRTRHCKLSLEREHTLVNNSKQHTISTLNNIFGIE